MNQRLGQKKKGKAKNTANSPTGSTLSTPSIAKPQSQNLLATLKEHPVVVAVSLLLWFLVAAATIVPAAGYVQEKWHETIPAVDFSGDIDQQKPFSIPLAIKNPSGIFAMHNPRISCWTDVDYESQPAKTFSARAVSSQGAISAGLQINPGEVRNYFCDVGGAFNLHEGTSATGPIIPIKLADMLIVVDYETWLPWTITRQGLTKFIMFPTTKGFRWAKGDWVAGQGITWLPDFKPPWGNERPK